MNDDRKLASLLGDVPAAPDPAFRLDVLALVAGRARRRAAFRRGAAYALGFTLLGLVVPGVRAAGLEWAELQPMLLAAGALVFGYVAAGFAAEGPGGLAARSRLLLRAHP
jgi:hypothetical protein